MHRPQEVFGFVIQPESLQQIFQRGNQQGERCTQLMADIGEKAALDLIELLQFLVGFFEGAAAFVQLKAQRKFAESVFGVKKTSGHDDYAGEDQEIKIILEVLDRKRPRVKQAGAQIH